MNKLEIIYNSLYSHFGPQHWWPVAPEGRLIPEYSGGQINAHCDYCKNIYTRRGMD
ncbi:hypothetical protein HYX08_01605 [Candidatus Woesearchaeota archaeon]|nr:hypothetical protein [Candidatus Woesearchaeota archaeon]